tara:strand:+ start:6869 stop:7303 length:435 start_codon:yes stop_codon:yes gene_type:complete
MRLSNNFHLHEFTLSQTAARYGVDNTPPPEAVAALSALVTNVLQPLRDYMGRPLIISSGYRSPWLNKQINGATNSQHMKGEAADFECWGVSNVELFHIVARRYTFDQLILEYHEPDMGPNDGWVHASFTLIGPNRGQWFRHPAL